MIYKITENRWNNSKGQKRVDEYGQKWMKFVTGTGESWERVEFANLEISPLRGVRTIESPWEGNCYKKPWDYEITAAVPCLGTVETLPIVIELLRLQTIRPYIMIIDTGSTEEELKAVEKFRDPDIEVHSIRLNGVRHPSDYPAMAMDLAFALCRSSYCFATHADVFLRKRTFLEEVLELCKTKSPAVGYELSERAHADWKGMISHTASMYDMKIMDQIGFGWSLRRLCHQYDIVDYRPDPMRPNWPDTEILGNYVLKQHDIQPYLLGPEGNMQRTLDENIDHFRSLTAAKLYSPKYYLKVKEWYEDARKQALQRIERWREEV